MRESAGLIMYRHRDGRWEVLLVHPGGPYWARRDRGAWSIPKGKIEPSEDPLAAACREFKEETGFPPKPPFYPLQPIRQRSGKIVHAWAFEGDCDPKQFHSNRFDLEWPPKSGKMRSFPEIDRAAFFPLGEAKQRILPAQVPLLDELEAWLVHTRRFSTSKPG
ncbi:MAG: NUDIX domain-containing protein [Verrucomicrobia bacterium]|nr:NUDIX domain-containing protein [Verrucomicrobiota bacterium]